MLLNGLSFCSTYKSNVARRLSKGCVPLIGIHIPVGTIRSVHREIAPPPAGKVRWKTCGVLVPGNSRVLIYFG